MCQDPTGGGGQKARGCWKNNHEYLVPDIKKFRCSSPKNGDQKDCHVGDGLYFSIQYSRKIPPATMLRMYQKSPQIGSRVHQEGTMVVQPGHGTSPARHSPGVKSMVFVIGRGGTATGSRNQLDKVDGWRKPRFMTWVIVNTRYGQEEETQGEETEDDTQQLSVCETPPERVLQGEAITLMINRIIYVTLFSAFHIC